MDVYGKFPPVIKPSIGEDEPKGIFVNQDDPAALLVTPSRFQRPELEIPGKAKFVWPNGTEGIRITGQAALAEHRYLGDNALVVSVTHRDARRITLTGMFTGTQASLNVRNLQEIIVAETPPSGKLLRVPGVFSKDQQVFVADYEFNHDEDDATDSFTYTITFAFVGVGKKIADKKKVRPRSNLNPRTRRAKPKGKTHRVFTVHAGARTLRGIAKKVYGNANRWREIYSKNKQVLNSLQFTVHQLPTKTLPLGLKLHY